MFKAYNRYGNTLNSYDGLKLIALATMVIDHFGAYLCPDAEWLRAIGRMAFPLFLFLVGYSGSWNIRRDLLVNAGLVAAWAILTHHPVFPLNILVTITLTRLIMPWLVRESLTPLWLTGFFLINLLIVFSWAFFWCDYGPFAILFAMGGYLQRHRPGTWTTLIFLYASLASHFLIQDVEFAFHARAVLLTIPVAAMTVYLMQTFKLEPLDTVLSRRTTRLLQWASRNTLPLYTLHVVLFMGLERFLFPERLLHFQWI